MTTEAIATLHTIDAANREKNWGMLINFLNDQNNDNTTFYAIKVIILRNLPVEVIKNIVITFNFDLHQYNERLVEDCILAYNYVALEYFIECGINIPSVITNGKNSCNILKLAADYLDYGNEKIISLLLKNGFDPNSDGGYAFKCTVKRGIRELVQIFIDYGIDIKYQIQALNIAIKEKQINIVKILVDAGISVDEIIAVPDPITNADINYLVDIGIDPIILLKMWYKN